MTQETFGPIRTALACAAVALASVVLAASAVAQGTEGPNRPSFLAGMGLLEMQEINILRDGAPFASLALPRGGGVSAVARDLGEAGDDVIAAWDFRTEDGRFVESLTLTTAEVDLAEREVRRFAVANLLVLRSFPQLAAQFPSARILGFGPVPQPENAAGRTLDSVQMVGSFRAPDATEDNPRGILFRHVAIMDPDKTEVIVAIINIDATVFPVRSQSDILDTFAGRALMTLGLAAENP